MSTNAASGSTSSGESYPAMPATSARTTCSQSTTPPGAESAAGSTTPGLLPSRRLVSQQARPAVLQGEQRPAGPAAEVGQRLDRVAPALVTDEQQLRVGRLPVQDQVPQDLPDGVGGRHP